MDANVSSGSILTVWRKKSMVVPNGEIERHLSISRYHCMDFVDYLRHNSTRPALQRENLSIGKHSVIGADLRR